MIIGIAADHRGYKLKEKVKKYLKRKHIEFIDYGTNSVVSCDYTDYAFKLCEGVTKEEVECGILICGTGIGMSIAANKVKGIMCAKVDNSKEARLAKEHNHANVISFSADLLSFEAKDIVDSFLKSNYLENEKYLRRIEKIKEVENGKVKKKVVKKVVKKKKDEE